MRKKLTVEERKERKRKYAAAYHLANKEKLLQQSRERYYRRREEVLARQAEWYQANREHALARDKVYREKNKKRIAERKIEYHKQNAEKINARSREWEAGNKERAAAAKKAWKAANPDAVRAHKQRRRERAKLVGGSLSGSIIPRLRVLQKERCAICYQPLCGDEHLDHIVPLSLGGTNEDFNVQLTHGRCNMQKHAKHPVDFMQTRGKLL